MEEKKVQHLLNLHPREFEIFIAHYLLPELGYDNIELTSYTGDRGYDISAYKKEYFTLFECKRFRGNVGKFAVKYLNAACERLGAPKGIIVTTSQISKKAVDEYPIIECWDRDILTEKLKKIKNISQKITPIESISDTLIITINCYNCKKDFNIRSKG